MATQNQNVTQTVTTNTQLPQWYQDYLTNLMTGAQNVAATPYQAYSGQRVADTNQDLSDSYQRIQNMAGSATPWLQGATDNYNQSADTFKNLSNFGPSTLDAISGYMSAAQNAGQQNYGQATNLLTQSANRNTASAFDPYASAATNYVQNAGAQANPYINQSTQALGLSAASPFLGMASASFPDQASQYMSPYTSAVTDRIAQLGARNLKENILPGINDSFIRSGQFGSSNNRDLVGRAIRDTQDSVLGTQANALEQGYGQAGQLFNQDANRYAGLAGTAGQLGGQQQQSLLQAGNILGNLSLGQASQIGNIGQFGTQAQAADAARQIAAGQGIANIGQAQQQGALGLANLAGNLQSGDYTRQLQAMIASGQGQQGAGAGLLNTAQTGTNLSLAQIAAQNAAGLQQQTHQQTSLDQSYQDFLNQKNYPQQQLDFLSSIIHGLPVNTSSYQSATGPATQSQLQPNTAAQVGGILGGISGLSQMGFAKGGAVKMPTVGPQAPMLRAPMPRLPKVPRMTMPATRPPRIGLGAMMSTAA